MSCKRASLVLEDEPSTPDSGMGAGGLGSPGVREEGQPYRARPQYSVMGERARRLAPPGLQCALTCGGANCKYERAQRWPPDHLALQGVYSHWITEDILAMARPGTASIAAWNLIQQFHSWGIKSVINLQAAGEHAHCGPPLESSGFTYDPSVFMNNNIFYYNFAWRDYGAAGLRALLDAVKVLVFAVGEGKVAIHCHAGLGRTGVLVACYLVHAQRVTADEAIRRVRARRSRAVQTAVQVSAVHHFEKYLLPQTAVFSIREPLKERNKQQEFGLLQHLHRQKVTLHGFEERAFRYLPKIIYFLCEKLLRSCGCEEPGTGFSNRPPTSCFLVLRARRARSICSGEVDTRQCDCSRKIRRNEEATTPGDEEKIAEDASAEACSVMGPLAPAPSPCSPVRDADDGEHSEESSEVPTPEDRPGATPSQVAEALLMEHSSLSEERQKYLRNFQIDLNTRSAAFLRINTEEDLRIIAALLMEWLEGLKMPVLDAHDLATVVVWGEKPLECLLRLELEDAILVEYLLRVLSRLRAISCEARAALVRRFAGALSQQGVRVRGVLQPSRSRARPMRAGTAASLSAFLARLHALVREDTFCSLCNSTKSFQELADSSSVAFQRSSLIIVQPSPTVPSKRALSRPSKSLSLSSVKSIVSSPIRTSYSMNDIKIYDTIVDLPVGRSSRSCAARLSSKSEEPLRSSRRASKSIGSSSSSPKSMALPSSIEHSLLQSDPNLISTVAEYHLD